MLRQDLLTFNIYCDESCHLEHDRQTAMVLGAIWARADESKRIADMIRTIKRRHGVAEHAEVKWVRVSPSKAQMYLDLVDYFFDDPCLHFRAVIIPNKSQLQHEQFGQTHDEWYYKMYFRLLYPILSPSDRYRIYLDIKDTKGGAKARHLRDVLCNSKYDFSRQIIEWIQIVRSHEVQIVQLADLLIGAISYVNRGLAGSKAKASIVARMQERSQYSLLRSTLYRATKVNLFRWEPKEALLQ